MGRMEQFVPAPPAAITRVLATFDRNQLEGFIAVALDLLDLADGDPEAEDSTDLEDDFAHSEAAEYHWQRQDPDREAGAYAEWHTLQADQRQAGACLVNACGHEDDEAGGDETDGTGAEDEEVAWFRHLKAGPGCAVSDSDTGEDGF